MDRFNKISHLYRVAARNEPKKFMLYDLDDSEVDSLYSIFKESYEKSVGESWTKNTFLGR